jgi:hypothetical protein
MIQQHHRALCEEASETLAKLTIIFFAALALTNHDGRGGGACNVKRAMSAN